MKKNKRKWIVWSVLLVVVVLVGTLFGLHMLSPDKALDLSAFQQVLPVVAKPIPEERVLELAGEGFQLVADNGTYTLELDTVSVSLRITNKKTGLIWHSGYPIEEYEGNIIPRDRRIMRTLCSIAYTDFDSIEETISNAADEVETTYSPLKDGVELRFNFPEQNIALSMQFVLDETGFRVYVPKEKIEETGAFGLVQIDILPAFGSVMSGENGYIFYPDGCGALYDCKGGTGYDQMYSQDIYGDHGLDFDKIAQQNSNGQKSILLPCIGSAAGRRGFIAYMETGSEYSRLSFSPSSSFFKLNRVYATTVYRRIRMRTTPDKKEIYVTERVSTTGDVCIKYLLLADECADYSGMATALRTYLQQSGRLPQTKPMEGAIPLALEILLGTRENNLYGKTGLAMTSYRQAAAILDELSAAGVDYTQTVLLGWQKEGYGQYPLSVKPAGFLGGERELKALLAKGNAQQRLLLQNDYVQALEGGRFSKQTNAVVSFLNMPITDSLQTRFLLNPYQQYQRLTKDLIACNKLGAAGLAFDSLSDWLPSDYGKNRKLTSTDVKKIYASMLDQSQKSHFSTAVQKGSDYLLPYADYLYNVYDSDSNLFAFSRQIPFFQMVVHGSEISLS